MEHNEQKQNFDLVTQRISQFFSWIFSVFCSHKECEFFTELDDFKNFSHDGCSEPKDHDNHLRSVDLCNS